MAALSAWQLLPVHGSFSAMAHAPNPYRGFRYPAEVIQHAVWLYHCFSLSLRNVETILAVRGIMVSYESIRAWGLRFGCLFANELKRRRPRPCTKTTWMRCSSASAARRTIFGVRSIRTATCWTSWVAEPAQHEDGQVVLPKAAARLTVSASGNRDRQAQELRHRQAPDTALCRAPAEQIPEQLGRSVAPADMATRTADAAVQVSAPPLQQLSTCFAGGTFAASAQRFLSAHACIHNHFQLRRHRLTAVEHRAARDAAFRTWRKVAAVADVA